MLCHDVRFLDSPKRLLEAGYFVLKWELSPPLAHYVCEVSSDGLLLESGCLLYTHDEPLLVGPDNLCHLALMVNERCVREVEHATVHVVKRGNQVAHQP